MKLHIVAPRHPTSKFFAICQCDGGVHPQTAHAILLMLHQYCQFPNVDSADVTTAFPKLRHYTLHITSYTAYKKFIDSSILNLFINGQTVGPRRIKSWVRMSIGEGCLLHPLQWISEGLQGPPLGIVSARVSRDQFSFLESLEMTIAKRIGRHGNGSPNIMARACGRFHVRSCPGSGRVRDLWGL